MASPRSGNWRWWLGGGVIFRAGRASRNRPQAQAHDGPSSAPAFCEGECGLMDMNTKWSPGTMWCSARGADLKKRASLGYFKSIP